MKITAPHSGQSSKLVVDDYFQQPFHSDTDIGGPESRGSRDKVVEDDRAGRFCFRRGAGFDLKDDR